MNSKKLLPPPIQEAADAALSELSFGNQNPEYLKPLYEWLESDGWEHLTNDPHERFAIWLDEIADQFTDSAVRANLQIEDCTAVEDHDRMRWALRYVEQAELESDRLVALPTFPIHGKNGSVAYIGCLMTAPWQNGPICDWQGLWVTREAFLESVLATYRLWPIPADRKITDQAILELWERSSRS